MQDLTEADQTTDALLLDWERWCSALGAQATAKRLNGCALFATGVPVPPLNCVFTARPAVAPAEVAELLDTVAGLGLPHNLEIRPGCRPEVAALARSRGMRQGASIPLMRRDASQADNRTAVGSPPLVVRELGADEIGLHASIASAAFEAPAAVFAAVITPAVLALPGFHCYVGTAGGQPITTAVGIVEGNHVGIYNVATLPEHQGRGFGAAITAHAFRGGFAAGASFAYLQSSDAGFAVYRRLGFRAIESWEPWVGGTTRGDG